MKLSLDEEKGIVSKGSLHGARIKPKRCLYDLSCWR